ncbi:MAG: right-handed parallel beta-helix repeat-containing protein [Desulfobacteraceae bacterium]|nr:right-handed parallel beta-helix repeat-containing protein [Desulfobacteraceae bacterium]
MRRLYSVTKAGHNGICITGTGNTVQNCKTYTNGNTGLNLKSGAGNNLITGCKSYDNYDKAKQGEDADGFGVKAGSASGNRFVNCESYNNSDDGWDFWDNQYGVRLEGCYAHNNGRDVNGDGNGFKLGNDNTSANHYLKDCTATNNRACGFTQNGNKGANTYINCVSSGNGKADVR